MAVPRLIPIEEMIQESRPFRVGQELRTEPNESPGRYPEFKPHSAMAVILHFLHSSFSHAHLLCHDADKFFRHVDDQQFHRFVQDTADRLGYCLGHGYGKLIPLTPHHFNKYGKLQFTASHDSEGIGHIETDFYRHIVEQFFFEALPEISRGDELALPASEWRGVH